MLQSVMRLLLLISGLGIGCLLAAAVHGHNSYLSESWAMLSGRPTEPACVNIPKNFTLCHGIDYTQMRIPNLLDHETIHEATEQAASWIPLLRLNCHADTQLFLCSLFAPVCLDRTIYPCRTLCETVKSGCENRMRLYGFPWPEMLNCDKFPVTHDMCIQPRAHYSTDNQSCLSCHQIGTYENILDNFCRSTYVMKIKVNSVEDHFIRVKRGKTVKPLGKGSPADNQNGNLRDPLDELKGVRLMFSEDRQSTCPCEIAADKKRNRKAFLVMANKGRSGDYVMNLILPWKKEKQFKRAVRMFRNLDCATLGRTIRDGAQRERSRHNIEKHRTHPKYYSDSNFV